MKTEFTVEYLAGEELQQPKVLQHPTVVRVQLEGERELCAALVALIKTAYTII